MVQDCQRGAFLLAADRVSAARDRLSFPHALTSPRQTRVRRLHPCPSGRLSGRGHYRPIITPGCRACGYKTASGRGNWLSRDPITERGGRNLYGFIRNNPISNLDRLGLFPFCNKCKLNQVILLKEEWEIGVPGLTAEEIENQNIGLRAAEDLHKGVSILELAEGKPTIFFPSPTLDEKLVNDLLMFRSVNMFGRITYKVCLNYGPRFWLFGSDQLDWSEEKTQGWDPSDGNEYISGSDAVNDSARFMTQMLVKLKNQYPDAP